MESAWVNQSYAQGMADQWWSHYGDGAQTPIFQAWEAAYSFPAFLTTLPPPPPPPPHLTVPLPPSPPSAVQPSASQPLENGKSIRQLRRMRQRAAQVQRAQLQQAASQSGVPKGVGVKRAREAFPADRKVGPFQRALERGREEQRRGKKQRLEALPLTKKALPEKGARRVALKGAKATRVAGTPTPSTSSPHLLAESGFVTDNKAARVDNEPARVGGVATKPCLSEGRCVGEALELQAKKVKWRSRWDQKGEADAPRREDQSLGLEVQDGTVLLEKQTGQAGGSKSANKRAKEGPSGEMEALKRGNQSLLSKLQNAVVEKQKAYIAELEWRSTQAWVNQEQRAVIDRCQWAESEMQAMKTLCDSLSGERDRLQRQVHASQEELEAAKAASKAELEAAKVECEADLEAVKAAYKRQIEAAKGETAAANKLLAVAKNVNALRLKTSKVEAEAAKRLREESEEALKLQKKACAEMSDALAALQERDADVSARLGVIGAKLGIQSARPEDIQVAVVSSQSALGSAKEREKELERRLFYSGKDRTDLRRAEDRAKQLERKNLEQEKMLQEGKVLLEERQRQVQDLKADLKVEKEKGRLREAEFRKDLRDADARVARLEASQKTFELDNGARRQSSEARRAKKELEEGEVAPELPDILQDESSQEEGRESQGRSGFEASEFLGEGERVAAAQAKEGRNGWSKGVEELEGKLAAERQRVTELEKDLELSRQQRESLEGALRVAEVERLEELKAREGELFEEVQQERRRREFLEREMEAAEADQMEELEARERELREAGSRLQQMEQQVQHLKGQQVELEKAADANLCLCLERDSDTVVVPCGHTMCAFCWEKHEKMHKPAATKKKGCSPILCPLCKAEAYAVQPVYKSGLIEDSAILVSCCT